MEQNSTQFYRDYELEPGFCIFNYKIELNKMTYFNFYSLRVILKTVSGLGYEETTIFNGILSPNYHNLRLLIRKSRGRVLSSVNRLILPFLELYAITGGV
jgi:hypothetical protein